MKELQHYNVICNFLKRFDGTTLSAEDYETTVRDTLWNVDQIIGLIPAPPRGIPLE